MTLLKGIGRTPRLPGAARLLLALISGGILASAAQAGQDPPNPFRKFQETVIHVAPPQPGAPPGDGSTDRPLRDLYTAAQRAAATRDTTAERGGVTISLAPGDYWLSPISWTEPTCGNCQDPNQPVPVTVGLRLSGTRVHLEGSEGLSSVIHTRAGYGILVQDCRECGLKDLVITGGARDTSASATDAAVVAQRSSVEIRDCLIRDNIGDSILVERNIVGIIGIAGREGSRMQIQGNRILRNSWDGIALYRDAEATVLDNTIDGVDLAVGRRIGGGRGVGIGLTWNAQGLIRGNRVTRYWKGIGLFVDARARVEENVVEQIATWGLSLWDGGQGRPVGHFEWNAVDSTGACGAMLDCEAAESPAGGSLLENAFSRTGQNPRYDSGEPYCFQTAVASHAAPKSFRIEANLFHENREAGGQAGSGDRDLASFRQSVQPLCTRLTQFTATRESAFFHRFGTSPAPAHEKERYEPRRRR